MDQVQVHVVDAQALERLVEGPSGVGRALRVVPQLRGDEHLAPVQARCRDRLADLGLVAVRRGRVDQAVAGLQRVLDGGRRCPPAGPGRRRSRAAGSAGRCSAGARGSCWCKRSYPQCCRPAPRRKRRFLSMILAIDQGTTGTTCLVFDREGELIGQAYAEFEQHFPRPGWVEHDADEIWSVTNAVARRALDDAGLRAGRARRGRNHQPARDRVRLGPRATGGRCTGRSSGRTGAARPAATRCAPPGSSRSIRERTGLVLDPYFSATKIEWLLRHVDGLASGRARGARCSAPWTSWLIFKLTRRARDRPLERLADAAVRHPRGSPGTPSCSSCSGCRNARSRGCGRPAARSGRRAPMRCTATRSRSRASPETSRRRCSARRASIRARQEYVRDRLVPAPECRLHGARAGRGGADYGWLEDRKGRLTYAVEAAIFVTGAAVQWLRDGLGIIDAAGETEQLARSLDGNDGVYFVPALTGLGSPQWDPYARGTIVGLTRGSGRAHLARAALESIAYQSVDAARAIERAVASSCPSFAPTAARRSTTG